MFKYFHDWLLHIPYDFCIIFLNLDVVINGYNNELFNILAYILLLNYVWHT